MNREFEFRAWDIENKAMVYDNENNTLGHYYCYQDSDLGMINKLLKNKNYIFMQYTGFKDKNGRKIFEGDILRQDHFWNNDKAGHKYKTIEWKINRYNITEQSSKTYYVIGNIYENIGGNYDKRTNGIICKNKCNKRRSK